ncbi:SRPBCC family protein [Proteiniphilum sp. X52]|uniref:SRPBCC family protein n=1 Tax=Proteiniphilum sp. X52 TaxID=2382159 RepID=UPI0013144848|nr:SRPBCC family protein [Proteiniphilum sp. X52]
MNIKNFELDQQQNVGVTERILSFGAGLWLFSKAFRGRNKLLKAFAGGSLMLRAVRGHCPLYHTLGMDTTSHPKRVLVETAVTVSKPREEVYAYWRKLENLPLFMKHLESVRELSDLHSVWNARIPGGLGKVEWKCEITSDVPNESIKWKSMPDSQVVNTGLVRFADMGHAETIIQVNISYEAPAGNLGAGIAKLFTPALEKIIRDDIKNFKRVIEAEEFPVI